MYIAYGKNKYRKYKDTEKVDRNMIAFQCTA